MHKKKIIRRVRKHKLQNDQKPPIVYWIVSEGNEYDNGEFGVEINGVPYFYYKRALACKFEGVKYRRVEEREFGEVITSNTETERYMVSMKPEAEKSLILKDYLLGINATILRNTGSVFVVLLNKLQLRSLREYFSTVRIERDVQNTPYGG